MTKTLMAAVTFAVMLVACAKSLPPEPSIQITSTCCRDAGVRRIDIAELP